MMMKVMMATIMNLYIGCSDKLQVSAVSFCFEFKQGQMFFLSQVNAISRPEFWPIIHDVVIRSAGHEFFVFCVNANGNVHTNNLIFSKFGVLFFLNSFLTCFLGGWVHWTYHKCMASNNLCKDASVEVLWAIWSQWVSLVWNVLCIRQYVCIWWFRFLCLLCYWMQ